jgi:preprotein translocase subunit Sec61beta
MMGQKIRLPSSEGGLVRYGEETPSLINIKPETVVSIIIGIMVLLVVLNVYGPKFF